MSLARLPTRFHLTSEFTNEITQQVTALATLAQAKPATLPEDRYWARASEICERKTFFARPARLVSLLTLQFLSVTCFQMTSDSRVFFFPVCSHFCQFKVIFPARFRNFFLLQTCRETCFLAYLKISWLNSSWFVRYCKFSPRYSRLHRKFVSVTSS